jgi:hypothetical protein
MGFDPHLLPSMMKDESLIQDLCRFADGILTEKQVRQRWHLADDDIWFALGREEAFVERIEFVRTQRIRSGATKRELAQPSQERSLRLAVKTPVAATLADPGVTTAEKVYRLMPGTCRWCEGDPQRPDFRFCGRPVVVQPYCEEHCRTAYLAPLVDSAASKWLFHLRRRTTSAAGRLPVTIPST